MNSIGSRRIPRRSRLWLAIGLGCALAAAPALAQERRDFDLPPQEAAGAIRAAAEQSGLQIMAPEGDLRGVRTRAVHGSFEAIEALRLMFEGTGLEVVASGADTVTVRRPRAPAPRPDPGVPGPQPDGQTVELDRIEVTGTRIDRAGFDTLQAALVTTGDEIERRGYTNIGQALEDTPGFGPSASSPVGAEPATLGVAQTFVNFFGLGSQRTLTLVNGRRFVSSNTVAGAGGAAAPGSQVDLNVIPAGLVDRVETVAIGGAPVYGSDAIAGTVNVILKEDFEGAEASVQYGITDRGDAESYSVRGLFGGNFADGRGNAVIGTEYHRQHGLRLSDRMPFRFDELPNPDDTGPADGIPSVVVVDDLRYALFTEGGLPYDNQLEPLVGFDLPGLVLPPFYPRGNYVFDADGTPLHFGVDGELVPYRPGTVLQAESGAPILSDGGDGMNPADHFGLLTPSERTIFNALGHFDITPAVRAFAETTYVRTEGVEQSELYQYAVPLLGGPTLRFSADNPFLSERSRAILADNGLEAFNLSRNLNDVVDRHPGETALDLYRFVGGLKGDFAVFGDTWSWDLSYNYGRSESVSSVTYIDPARLLRAIDAVDDGTGGIVCASGGDCVPINLFGTGNASAEAVDWVTDRGRATSLNTQRVLTGNLTGAFPLGLAEPLQFNLGAERRTESGAFEPDATLEAGNVLIGTGAGSFEGIEGSYRTTEFYGELVVPLIAESQALRFAKALSLEAAARHVDNSLTGSDVTWSVGARFAPRLPGWGDGLVLRGVYTHAIRSPAITELFLGSAPVSGSIDDVCNAQNYNRGANPAVREANCRAALAAVGVEDPADFESTTGAVSAFGTRSGNVDLMNETADSWSLGFVYQPTALPGFRLAMDWSDISLEDGIQNLGIDALLAACYDSANWPEEPACASFERLTAEQAAAQPGAARNAGDIANGYRTGFVNTSTLDFSGLIGAAEYRFDLGAGSMRVGSKLSYTHKYEIVLQPGVPVRDAVGSVGTPEYRANLSTGYTLGDLELDLQALWTSSVVRDLDATGEDLPREANHVGDYWRFNATVAYWLGSHVKAQLAIQNLFDREVPYAAQVGRNFGAYDPIGRTYLLRLSANF
ncbi:TonB-dependent receptor [Luteimonas sp. RD2P54]|uniref:TonB-dependent receptor n=1 Tax=Luteimonas endophytica TaxID=3042023 RepID=A0ABT6J627_9GAMM|nr:TonB-dependent receptor [Luteimonas endophytica]MDH5822281.1 TonB-dependent receptor [Luteimonas endophytica]